MAYFSPPTSPETVCDNAEQVNAFTDGNFCLFLFLVVVAVVILRVFFSPVLQESKLDMRTSAAVESLLSLRGSVEEWRPPSPASSVTSENLASPPRVSREEVISSQSSREERSTEPPESPSGGALNMVSTCLLTCSLRLRSP